MQRRAVVRCQGDSVRGRNGSAGPVDLGGELGKPAGYGAVTETDRGVQSHHFRGGLVLRRGQLRRLPGQRNGFADGALSGGDPTPSE